MTLDIAKLKAAAEKARWGNWSAYKPHKGARGYEVRVGCEAVAQHCLKDDADFIAEASPKVVLELIASLGAKDALIAEQDKRLVDYAAIATKSASRVAELEKKAAFLNEKLSQLANFNPDWDMLEAAADSLREHMTELTAANKRIAELEAQASAHDRLCDSNYLAGMTVGWNFGIVEDSDGFDKCHAARARRWPDDSVSLKIEGE